jgi:large subunit ribosomal protein L23
MGLLDRWSKKTEEEQLKAAESNASDVVVDEKKKEKTSKTASKATKTKKQVTGNAYKVLVRPIISEKAASSESNGVYTFVVAINANKIEIKKAIKQVYGIMPKKVRVMNMEGKRKRFGRRFGRRNDWKKAIITLPKGQSINIHEGV